MSVTYKSKIEFVTIVVYNIRHKRTLLYNRGQEHCEVIISLKSQHSTMRAEDPGIRKTYILYKIA